MVALAKVLARGQITIPRDVREKVHLAPGDLVRIEPIGVGKFVVEVIPTLSLDEILSRYQSNASEVDIARLRADAEAEAADEVIGKLSKSADERE